jgi:enamine deaminase RidA (YjgF/YER057c/UK114 family)
MVREIKHLCSQISGYRKQEKQMTQQPEQNSVVQYLNPEGLHKNRAFSQVVSVSGPAKTIYVGGQDAVDEQGNIVGKDDITAQTRQVLSNLEKALAGAGAELKHIIKWNIYLVQGQSLQAGFAAFQQIQEKLPQPPTITMAYVAGLAHPDFLVEMDATAVIPGVDQF